MQEDEKIAVRKLLVTLVSQLSFSETDISDELMYRK